VTCRIIAATVFLSSRPAPHRALERNANETVSSAKGDGARVLALFFGCKRTIFNFSGSNVNDEFGELSRVAGPFRVLRHPPLWP
jgi:hypothetical protein